MQNNNDKPQEIQLLRPDSERKRTELPGAVQAAHEKLCFDLEDENDREPLREDPYAEYPNFPAEYRMKDETQVEMIYC